MWSPQRSAVASSASCCCTAPTPLSRCRFCSSGSSRAARIGPMCRNIRTLHNFEPPATSEEVSDAALQYVRKISGSTKPSKANEEAFERAVEEVTLATQRLLDGLVTAAPPKDREVEAAKRRARAAERYATA